MAWSDFTPLPTPAFPNPRSASVLLAQQIIPRCDGWLAIHPPDPVGTPLPPPPPAIPATERQRWQRIREDAQMDLQNVAHPQLRDFVDPAGQPMPGTTLDQPWGDVSDCRLLVYKPLPTMDDLKAAIEFIDHLGGGAPPGVISPPAIAPPAQVVTTQWPDVGFSAPMITARSYLDAILSHSVGQLLRSDLSQSLRAAYESLAGAALMDRENLPHGHLRKFVRADRCGVGATGMKKAWKHLVEALAILNGYTVSAAQVAMARRLVNHDPV